MKIDGKKIAEEILKRLEGTLKPRRRLAAIKVGENPAAESFLKIKKKTAERLGVDFKTYEFSESISNEKLREEVGKIAKQKVVGGVIIQLPLPAKFNRQKIIYQFIQKINT